MFTEIKLAPAEKFWLLKVRGIQILPKVNHISSLYLCRHCWDLQN